jgi:hypothetical protein
MIELFSAGPAKRKADRFLCGDLYIAEETKTSTPQQSTAP